MSEARRYPLSEWGAQRLRRAGIRPSTAAWYTVAWSTALLLCVYSAASLVPSFAGEFVDVAARYGLPPACAVRTERICSGDAEIRGSLAALGGDAVVGIAGLAGGVVVLAWALRLLGARPDSTSHCGWRTRFVGALTTALATAAMVAVGVWLGRTTARGGALGTTNPPLSLPGATDSSCSLIDTAGDWWMTAVVTTALVGGAVAAIHQLAARLDFESQWRMTEQERRDELRDTQMSPDTRRAISRRPDQR